MHPEVQLERGGVGERAGTDLAAVGPLPSVHAHMYGQLTPLVEPVQYTQSILVHVLGFNLVESLKEGDDFFFKIAVYLMKMAVLREIFLKWLVLYILKK